MLVDHIISGTCNSRIGEVIFIGGNTTLLDYKNQLMRSLHAMDSRSQTSSFVMLLFAYGIRVQLILCGGMLNQLHN